MCALVLLFRALEGVPLLVGANRDEARDRPSSPPGLLIAGAHRALAPRDRRSGGTWIGFNDRGVFAALTNRPGEVDAARPSRGEIVPLALDADSAAAALALVEARLAEVRDNPFRLVVADAREAYSLANDGAAAAAIAPGAHLLTNEHGLDAVPGAPLEAVRRARTAEEAEAAVRGLLADHAPHDGGHRFCKHGDARGTVSSTIVSIPDAGAAAAAIRFAAGPPCTAPYQDYSNLVRRLAG